MHDMDKLIEEARKRALSYIEWHQTSSPLLMGLPVRHEINLNKLMLEIPKSLLIEPVGDVERAETFMRYAVKMMADEKTLSVTKETMKVPADPLSHLIEWILSRVNLGPVAAPMARLVKHTEIKTIVHNHRTKLFFPPWPIKTSDQTYLTWVTYERNKEN